MADAKKVDLDQALESFEKRAVAEIIDELGIQEFRRIETSALARVLADPGVRILSLGGGTWTMLENRELIRESGFTSVWLESTFEHCWLNIAFSRKQRPLARSKEDARRLFEERQKDYCLADWHFIIKPDQTSHGVALQIYEEIFF